VTVALKMDGAVVVVVAVKVCPFAAESAGDAAGGEETEYLPCACSKDGSAAPLPGVMVPHLVQPFD